MMNSFLLVAKFIQRDNISRITVFDLSEWTVFSFFYSFRTLDISALQGIGHLNIRITLIPVSYYKITLKLSNFSNTHLIIMTHQIQIYDIFKRWSKIQSIIRIHCKINCQICQIIFLFPFYGLFAFKIKSITLIYYFCLF